MPRDYDVLAARLDGKTGDVPARKPLIAVGISEFLTTQFPPQEYLLDPVLPKQGLVMIHGPRGLGKTQLSIGIAVAVSSGGRFLKWSAAQPAGVLLIDGEMPANALQDRLAKAIEASDKEPTARLDIVTPDLNRDRSMPDMSTAEGQASVDALVTDETALLIVDNLSSLNRSGVENESESWTPLQTWALRHRAAGRSVLFIHHSGKGGAQRGTSRREDVLDTVIGLRRPGDYVAVQGARFEVHIEKGRSLYGKAAAAFEACLTDDQDGRRVWTLKDLEDGQDERIAAMHADGMKPGEIAVELNVHRATVYRRIKSIEQAAGRANGHA
jgi:KaiC/GvpD/RAD55 family RecA-like ATPase